MSLARWSHHTPPLHAHPHHHHAAASAPAIIGRSFHSRNSGVPVPHNSFNSGRSLSHASTLDSQRFWDDVQNEYPAGAANNPSHHAGSSFPFSMNNTALPSKNTHHEYREPVEHGRRMIVHHLRHQSETRDGQQVHGTRLIHHFVDEHGNMHEEHQSFIEDGNEVPHYTFNGIPHKIGRDDRLPHNTSIKKREFHHEMGENGRHVATQYTDGQNQIHNNVHAHPQADMPVHAQGGHPTAYAGDIPTQAGIMQYRLKSPAKYYEQWNQRRKQNREALAKTAVEEPGLAAAHPNYLQSMHRSLSYPDVHEEQTSTAEEQGHTPGHRSTRPQGKRIRDLILAPLHESEIEFERAKRAGQYFAAGANVLAEAARDITTAVRDPAADAIKNAGAVATTAISEAGNVGAGVILAGEKMMEATAPQNAGFNYSRGTGTQTGTAYQ